MNCPSCQARLSASHTACPVCGTQRPPGHAHAATGHPATPLVHSAYPGSEGWRIWTSFFLGGLYAPLAAFYLAAREEWTAGLGRGGLPPAPPSQRGAVVLLLSVALPILIIGVLGFVISVFDVRPRVGPGGYVTGWEALTAVHRFLWANLFIAALFPAFIVIGRHVNDRFRGLLSRLTADDARLIAAYDEGRFRRRFAALLTLAPLVLLIIGARGLLDHAWVDGMRALAMAYFFSVLVAAWCASWFVLDPALRFRAALLQQP